MTKLCQIPVISNGEKNNGLFGYTDKATIFEPSVTVSGRGTIGFSCVRKKPYFPIVRLITITPFSGIDLTFLQCTLLALLEQGVGTSIKQLTVPMLAPKLIPLPPLKEQERIVSRITTLDPLIEEYDKVERELATLNETFPDQIKKSILQYAIQGKLVPQDPKDEPASVLLEKIKAEKQKLIKAGKIKKEKQESYIYKRDNRHYEKIGNKEVDITDEIPFEIPASWAWVRLGTLFSHNTGKALNAKERDGKLLQYITTSNLYWNEFSLNNLKSMYFKETEIPKCTVTQGDLLICEGGDIGRAAIWQYPFDMRIQNHIHRLRPYIPISLKFYYYIFYFYKHSSFIGGKGIAIQGLSSHAIHQLFIPIPPLKEQQRIVEKIEQLFKILS